MTERATLSEPQERVLLAVRTFWSNYGYSPSVREVAARAGLRSSATAYTHLRALARRGYIARHPERSRSFTLVDAGRCGTCGQPLPSATAP